VTAVAIVAGVLNNGNNRRAPNHNRKDCNTVEAISYYWLTNATFGHVLFTASITDTLLVKSKQAKISC